MNPVPVHGRRSRAALALTLLLAPACGGGGGTTPTTPGATPTPVAPVPSATPTPSWRPSIVYLLVDDLDVMSLDRMPNLRSMMIDRGLTFTNGFATTPLCCPSRASIMTGQYAHNHGILINRDPMAFGTQPNCFEVFRNRGQERQTLGPWLQDAGYRTAFLGKYLNRYPGDMPDATARYVPPGWDDWFVQAGDNEYYNYDMSDNGNVVHYGRGPENYFTDVLRVRAVQFVERNADPDRPLFLWINPTAPHTPSTPSNEYDGAFADASAPRTPDFNEEDMSDKPRWFRDIPPFAPSEIEHLDGLQRQRLRAMASVDDLLGDVMNALEKKGILDRTYVVFSSDNGLLLGGHRLFLGKDAVYENSIRVPLVVRGPGVPAGRRIEQFVLNIDIAPTLVEMARAQTPGDFMDGRSLFPLLGSTPATAGWRSDFLVEHWTDTPEGLPTWAGVRTSNSIYVEYEKTAEKEFYDLVRDPFQLQNQAAGIGAATLDPLASRLRTLKACRGAACRQ